MPFYEFQCSKCGSRGEVFTRSISAPVTAPSCTRKGCKGAMERIMSPVIRQLTESDQMAAAEAKWGKEVDAVLGKGPDVGKHVRRYEKLAKDLPTPNDV